MSLVAWYKLDGNANDSSGNNYHGNVYGATVNANGKIGQCYSFDGVNDFIRTGTIPDSSQLTVALWFKANAIVGQDRLYWGYGTNRAILYINTNYTFGWYMQTDVATVGYTTSSLTFNAGVWNHVALTYNGNKVKLYVNGVLDSVQGVLIGKSSASAWNLGTDYCNASSWFNGLMNDFRVYDNALSDKEIRELWKAKILHYKFDDFQEPTTNVITNTNLDTGWSKGYCTGIQWNDIPPPLGVNSSVVSFYDADTTTSGYWYCYGDYAPQVQGQVYTVSLYVKTLDSNFRIAAYTADNSEVGRIFTEYITVPNDGEWHRVIWNSFTNPADSQSNSLSFNFSYGNPQGESQRTWLCAPQMEPKDHATPFVNGSRIGVVHDCSEYGNNATLDSVYTPQWINNSMIGNGSYYFNGADKAIQIPIAPPPEYSISMWFYKSDWGPESWETLFGGPGGFELESKAGATNSPKIVLYSWGDTTGASGVVYSLNQWNHIVFTRNASGTILYLNGTQVTTGVTGGIPAGNYFIGSWRDYVSQNYKGYIDDFRIYATTLSINDVLELYQTRSSLDDKGNLFTHQVYENAVNNCSPFKYWTLSGGAYVTDDGVLHFPNDGCNAVSPFIPVIPGFNSYFSAEYYSTQPSREPTFAPQAGVYSGVSYYDSNFNPTSEDSPNHYTGNGWASKYPLATWTRLCAVWGKSSTIYYVKETIQNSYWGGISLDVKNPMITNNGIWQPYYPYSTRPINNSESIKNLLIDKGIYRSNCFNEIGPTNGLIGYWPLDGNVNDYSGNKNNGVNNGAVISSGLFGKSYLFNNNDVTINSISPVPTTNVTVCAWFKRAGVPGSGYHIVFNYNGLGVEISIPDPGGQIRTGVYTPSRTVFNSGANLTDGNWHHVSLTYDGAQLLAYIDGVCTGSNPVTGTLSVNGSLVLGKASTYYANGYIEDARLYNRTLAADEIYTLYKMGVQSTGIQENSDGTIILKGKIKEY